MGTVKWTYEACYNVAKGCVSRKELQKKHCGAYAAARINHWIDNYTWFKTKGESITEAKTKWTYETCYEAAKECTSRKGFQMKYSGAYAAARINHWLDNYTWFRPTSELLSKAKKGKPCGRTIWTRETCYEAAKKCKTRKELQKLSVRAYQVSFKNGWIDEYTWLKTKKEAMSESISASKPSKYPRDACFLLAKQCENRTEFQYTYKQAYRNSLKNGWIDEMFPQSMDKFGKCDNVYRYYFHDFNAVYVGRTVDTKRRDREHIFKTEEDAVAKFAHEHNVSVPPMEILVSNIALREGQRLEGYYIDLYREQGYTILNRTKAGSLGAIGGWKWTFEQCKEEASKYTQRSRFKEASSGAYHKALKNHWLDQFFPK